MQSLHIENVILTYGERSFLLMIEGNFHPSCNAICDMSKSHAMISENRMPRFVKIACRDM